jgi:phage tail sheath protein FI
MPEYLAPGVYVEEIDTGSKPIEGVSTSTCGLVGVTERGPVNVPVLVTSVGEFVRWYGGLLREDDYGAHRFLPHAVEGFFTNGGKRTYVVRVLEDAASRAASPLFHAGTAAAVPSSLVRPAGEGTGTAATPPVLVILPGSGLAAADWVRVGDGSDAEYHQVAAPPVAETVLVPLALPLARSHAAGSTIDEFTRAVFAPAYALSGAVARGATQLVVRAAHADIAALVAGECLEIGAQAVAEYRYITQATSVTVVSATDSTVRLHLDAPLALAHADTTVVAHADLTAAPVASASVELATAGSGLVFVDDRQGNFVTRTNLVRIGPAATQELRRVGEFAQLDFEPASGQVDPGTLVEAVQFAADRTITNNPANAGDTQLTLQAGETDGLVVGERLVLDPTGTPETVTVAVIDASTDTITVAPPLGSGHAQNTAIVPLTKTTTAAAAAGSRVLSLDDRTGLDEGAVLQVGTGGGAQVVTVQSAPALTGSAPDPGNVVLSPPLAAQVPNGTSVQQLGSPAAIGNRQAMIVALPAAAGSTTLYVTDGAAFANGDTIRLTDAAGDGAYYTLTANSSATTADMLTLSPPALARAHPAGSMVIQRTPLIDVQALDAGIWGNRLRVSVEDESPGLVSNTTLATMVNQTTIRLASAAGVQPGTILEFSDPATGGPLGDPVKVSNVDRSAQNTITLAAPGLQPVQQVLGAVVRSHEFRITVRLLRQPDPSVPSRNNQVIDLETFRNLSLDPRHSNYVETVIGAINGPLRKWDRRPEGASLYIRVSDVSSGNQVVQHSVRLGPEALVDTLPDGRTVPAQLRLESSLGDDAIGAISDHTYVGDDNADPELRTGLQCLRNVEQISLVAVPGGVSGTVQQAAIDHCELMRYRFAVLDSLPEPTDTISDAQGQRQQFDSKYAALYYPWLTIPDPFPTNLADVHDYPIPPAGHMLGVYARTDIDRGVHKAPANEVVRGITGLRRKVNKEEQDILNPYPVNINVIRDFRDHNRGIRVYGGRVITSDPDWRYVNVRRLLIFIEASLERGLQWVVFEPNADPLWARVRRVVSNFLTTVWRNGALEGTKVEEAFFVKCDRTTMTQTDIDNGRLIVVVGVAPVKPAEFVIVRIGLWTAHADS